jgi:tetratricopeptide (TPR) repeat protein
MLAILLFSGCQRPNGEAVRTQPRSVVEIGAAIRDVLDDHRWPDVDGWRHDIRVMLAQGRVLQAADALETALHSRPYLVDAAVSLGRAYKEHGHSERGLILLETIAAARPSHRGSLDALHRCLAAEKAGDSSLHDTVTFLALALTRNVGRVPALEWLWLSFYYRKLGRPDKTAAALSTAEGLAKEPDVRGAIRQIEALRLLLGGDRLGARKMLERGDDGKRDEPIEKLLLAIARGDDLQDVDISAAADMLSDWNLRLALGVALLANGRHQDAMPHLRRTVELNAELESGLSAFLGTWLYSTSNFKEAIPFLEEALRQEATSDQVSSSALMVGNFKETSPFLKEAVRQERPRSVSEYLLTRML